MTELIQSRTDGCAEYDNCNNFAVSLDPEDIGVLPRPGRWDIPLDPVEQELYCGFGGINCISCVACLDDENQVDCRFTNGQVPPGASTFVYRKKYFDEALDMYVYNVCQTRDTTATFKVIGEDQGENREYVARGVDQLTQEC